MELQHGRRGAYARAARKLQCSDQHVANVVRRHEAKRQFLTIAPGYSQESSESENSLAYVPPPGGYPSPEPRNIAQFPAIVHPPVMHILSTPMSITARWQRSELKRTSTYSPIANANAAANLSYALAVFLTIVLVPVMCKDARLLVMLPVLLAVWSSAAEAQRQYRKLRHFGLR